MNFDSSVLGCALKRICTWPVSWFHSIRVILQDGAIFLHMQISYRQILSGGISQKASDDALRKLNDCHCQEKDYDKKHYPFIFWEWIYYTSFRHEFIPFFTLRKKKGTSSSIFVKNSVFFMTVLFSVAIMVKPVGDFLQSSDAVNRFSASAEFMVFTMKKTHSCRDTMH